MSGQHFSEVFEAIDNKDAASFVGFLTEDAVFVYGSQDPVQGREAIRGFVAGFFGTVDRLSHRVEQTWSLDGTAFVQGRVQYWLPGGREVSVPFLNLFRLSGSSIREYRVYIDPTPLAA